MSFVDTSSSFLYLIQKEIDAPDRSSEGRREICNGHGTVTRVGVEHDRVAFSLTKSNEMNALKNARRQLKADPTSESSQILASLVLALEAEGDESRFVLSSLYDLDLKTFDLAIEILQDWRIERYANKKAKLFTVSQKIQAAPLPDAVAAVIRQAADSRQS